PWGREPSSAARSKECRDRDGLQPSFRQPPDERCGLAATPPWPDRRECQWSRRPCRRYWPRCRPRQRVCDLVKPPAEPLVHHHSAREKKSHLPGGTLPAPRAPQGSPAMCRCMNSLAKLLLDSSWAAACVGPKIFNPRRINSSTTPSESGSSGPTTVKSGWIW